MLTKEQIKQLNDDLKKGITLTTVHNSRYHLIVKINTEAIVIQSMIADDNDKGVIINLKDIRDQYEQQNKESNPDNCEGM